MEKAIRKSIEGGYKLPKELKGGYEYLETWRGDFIQPVGDESGDEQFSVSDILLDPLFWQALGKSCGWRKHRGCGGNGICPEYPHCCEGGGETWKYHWHNFIDSLAEGGSADSFFTNLLK